MGFPEGPPNRRKEAILVRSPLLRSFLNQNPAHHIAPYPWDDELTRISNELDKVVSKRLGDNWDYLAISAFVVQAGQLDLFRKDIPVEDQFDLIKNMVLIGYEVGGSDKINLFIPDVLKKLAPAGLFVFDFNVDRDESFANVAYSTAKAWVHFGGFLNRADFSSKVEENTPEIPDVFKRFLGELYPGGI